MFLRNISTEKEFAINTTKYSKMDQVKFVEHIFKKFEAIWSAVPFSAS